MTRLFAAFVLVLSSLRLSAAAVVVRSVSLSGSPALVSPGLTASPGTADAPSFGSLAAPTLGLGALPALETLPSAPSPNAFAALAAPAASVAPASASAPKSANAASPEESKRAPPRAAASVKGRLAALTRRAGPLTEAAGDERSDAAESHATGSRLIRLLTGERGGDVSDAEAVSAGPISGRAPPSRLNRADRGKARFDFLSLGAASEEAASPVPPAPDLTREQKIRFRIYAGGVSAVKVGIETLHFVVPLLLLSQYGAASLVGGLFVASDLAGLVLGWVGSSWIDRWKPGRVMTGAALTQFAAIAAIPAALWLGLPLGLPAVMGLVVLNGAASGLFDIARRAQMPHLIGTDEGTLRRYNGELYIWREIAAIAGVFGAGALLSATGYLQTLILHPAFYMIAGYLFWRMTRRGGNESAASSPSSPSEPSKPAGLKHAWSEISRGARLVLSDPRLLLAAIINIPVVTIHNLFHKMIAAVYASVMLGSPSSAAVLIGVWNLGEFVSAIYLRTRGHKEGSAKWLVYAGFAGLGLWGLRFFPSIWVAAPVIFLLSTATLSNELGLASFFQSSVKKEDAGAVNGFVYSSASALSMVALLALGWAFDAYGVPAGLFALSAVMTAVSVFYWLAAMKLKRSGRD